VSENQPPPDTIASFTDALVAVCRLYGVSERDAVCCGTVSVQQCVVLQELREGPHAIGALAQQSGGSNSAMTRLVDGLERKGWVQRTRSQQDRRAVAVSLTDEGTGEADRLRRLTEQAVATVLHNVPADKHAQVLESLELLRDAITAARVDLGRIC
jgi:DNA-binding MarR family transcriptional regulator